MSVFDNIVFFVYPDYVALVDLIATTAEHCRDTSHSRTKCYHTSNRIFKLIKNSNQSEPIDKFSLPNFIQVICLVRIVCRISLRILVPAAWRRALHCRLQVLTPPTNNWKMNKVCHSWKKQLNRRTWMSEGTEWISSLEHLSERSWAPRIWWKKRLGALLGKSHFEPPLRMLLSLDNISNSFPSEKQNSHGKLSADTRSTKAK